MLYLCHLLGMPVKGADDTRMGKIDDLCIPVAEARPPVAALVVAARGTRRRVPWTAVQSLDDHVCAVAGAFGDYPEYVDVEREISLRQDLLDKQIVDTDGRRVVRVNDLQLLRSGDHLIVVGVDVSTLGLLRRLGWENLVERMAHLLGKSMARSVIPWDYVESLDVRDFTQVKLTITHQKLMGLHPADLAEILTDLHGPQREALFASLTAETAAETLAEMEDEIQVSLFRTLSDEQATSVLEEMDPDEAADLIAELPPERVQALLSRMDSEDAADVQELLSYDADSAGGVMTTEFIGLSSKLTAQQTIDHLRETSPGAETIYYLYVVDEEERLLGVLSLRDLIVSPPDRPITEFMIQNVVKVNVDDSIDEVRDNMTKYDLLAIPVVDHDNELKGIITVDDVMDRMMPSTWRRRFPRLF